MAHTQSVFCLECDHEHACPVFYDEYGESCDSPDNCEACGADMTTSATCDDDHERNQMGIC